MLFSKFLHVMGKNRITAVFHALHPDPIYIESSVWQSYKSGQKNSELARELRKLGLIIKSRAEDEQVIEAIKRDYLNQNSVSIMYLILTKRCNFSCKQCFQAERHPDLFPVGEKTLAFMTRAVAKKAIDLFVSHFAESDIKVLEPQVQFYGGEPLLNFSVIRYVVQRIEEFRDRGVLPSGLRFVIVTNGSLITQGIAQFFKEHNISVGLSIDGPKEFNDEFRIDVRGRGTYSRIVKALRILQKYDVEVTLSVTVNPNIVDKMSDVIHWATKEMGVSSVEFNPIGGKSFNFTGSRFSREQYDLLLAEGLVEAYKTARGLNIYEGRVGKKIEDFISRSFRITDCGAVYNQLVIYPDGQIGFCHAFDGYNIGNVFNDDFRIFKHRRIQSWSDALPIHNLTCHQCPAISICGYGCFHNVAELNQNLFEGDRQFCLHTQKIMDFIIWDLYEKSVNS